MKSQVKYPETATFHYFNANPKNRITGDCAYRAISTATGIPYNEVVMGCAEIHCKTGYEPTMGKGLEAYMASIGWVKHNQPRKADGTKYTGVEFCKLIQRGGLNASRLFCNIGGHHVVAIVDGKVNDIWDSTGKCVGNYWTKKEQ